MSCCASHSLRSRSPGLLAGAGGGGARRAPVGEPRGHAEWCSISRAARSTACSCSRIRIASCSTCRMRGSRRARAGRPLPEWSRQVRVARRPSRRAAHRARSVRVPMHAEELSRDTERSLRLPAGRGLGGPAAAVAPPCRRRTDQSRACAARGPRSHHRHRRRPRRRGSGRDRQARHPREGRGARHRARARRSRSTPSPACGRC